MANSTITFWTEMTRVQAINALDKVMLGINSTGEAQYTNFADLKNAIGAISGAGFYPPVQPGGTLGNPSTISFTFLAPGSYNGGSLVVPDNTLGLGYWNGSSWSLTTIPLPQLAVVDNLTSTSITSALSANQGRVLNDSKEPSINKKTTINSSDTEFPTSKAVLNYGQTLVVGKENSTNKKTTVNQSDTEFPTSFAVIKYVNTVVREYEKLTNKKDVINVFDNPNYYPTNIAVAKYVDSKIKDFSNVNFGGTIDETKDLSKPTEKIWYFAQRGTYNTNPSITIDSDLAILSYDGKRWTYAELNIEVQKDFIVFNTIAELRDISQVQIEYLRTGIIKSVIVNGYYKANDTPAPIQYYIADSGVDNGGSTIVVGGVKLEHDFNGYIHVSYFGCQGDGVTDNTLCYNNIISYASDNCIIEFEPNKEYVGNFISNKSFTVHTNKAILINKSPNQPTMSFSGEIQNAKTNVVGTLTYSDTFVNVANAAGFESGDLITISDSKLRPQGNIKVNFETLRVKSVDTVNNRIEVFDMIRSTQDVAPIVVDLIKPIKNPQVYDAIFKSDNLHLTHQLSFVGSDNAYVNNVVTFNSVGNAVNFSNSMSFKIDNVTTNKPRLNGGGQGYGVALVSCRDAYIYDIRGYEMRHLVDYSACYDITLKKVRDYKPFNLIQLAHNTFGGKLTVDDVIVDGTAYGALHVQGQGLDNFRTHILRDTTITNITHVITEPVSTDIRTIRLESSVNNIIIDNIRTINKAPSFTNVNTNCIVSIAGAINGDTKLSNLYSNLIGSAVLHSLGELATAPNLGVLDLNGIRVDTCIKGFTLSGTRSINVDNLYFNDAIASGGHLIDISSNYLTVANFGDNINMNTYVKLFGKIPNVLLMGEKPRIKTANETAIVVVSNITFSSQIIDNRTTLKLTHNFTGNLTLTSQQVFPNPQFYGEELLIELNLPTDFGIKGSVIIPSTNTNIINPDGGFGVTIRSGESVILRGSLLGSDKVWIAERISKNASTTVKGLVKQATASPDTATQASGAAPTKVEFDALLAELRDVKIKLRTAGALAPNTP